MNLSGKVALVTGASNGIGRATAKYLAKQGADVVVNYQHAGLWLNAKEVIFEIESLGRKAIAIKCDVTKVDEVANMVQHAVDTFGAIDILVNNAGIVKDGLILRMKEQDWDDVVNTNLKGTFLCTQAISKQMLKQKSGKIINIASVIGVVGNAGQANYVASKAGVIGLTKTTALELASRGINVNAVAPGFIQTEMTEKLPEEVKNKIRALIPLARSGSPEDVAKVVAFLATESANYITGQTIHVDGGMVM